MEENDPKKEELDILHEEDLLPSLEKLGLKQHFLEGKLKCSICEKSITLENLSAFFMTAGEIKFVCNDPRCLERVKT